MDRIGNATRRPGRRLLRALVAGAALAALAAGDPAMADYYDGLLAYEGQDYAAALRELEPLAGQGDARAQKLVGLMYRDGLNVRQDFVRAHMWLNLAASAGEAEAASARDVLASRMEPSQVAEAQSLAAVWQSGSPALVAVPAAERPLTRAQVTDLQWQLAVHGYDPGWADGIAGARTRAAIAQYQHDAALPADGEPTLALLDHLQFTDPPVRNPRAVADAGIVHPAAATAYAGSAYGVEEPAPRTVTVEPASGTMRVYALTVQQELANRGYRPGPVDGIVGRRTREAIRRYERDNGLPVTGRVTLELVNHIRLISGAQPAYTGASY